MKILILILIAAGIIGYFVLNTPDKRSSGEKISDAIHELPNGVDKAARQLEDRTPGEKLGDSAKDAADDLKKTINQ